MLKLKLNTAFDLEALKKLVKGLEKEIINQNDLTKILRIHTLLKSIQLHGHVSQPVKY